MTKEQYQAALERLGLDWRTAGPTLGVSKRQAFRFASGATPVPRPIAKLIRYMLRFGILEDLP
jgi:hypothetical protein